MNHDTSRSRRGGVATRSPGGIGLTFPDRGTPWSRRRPVVTPRAQARSSAGACSTASIEGALGPLTLLCAPAGSGKTMLLSSWLRRAELPGPVAWVECRSGRVRRDALLEHGRRGAAGSGALPAESSLATLLPRPAERARRAAGAAVRRLATAAAARRARLDDSTSFARGGARGLEGLLARAPAALRMFLVSRREPKLGLHRLRLSRRAHRAPRRRPRVHPRRGGRAAGGGGRERRGRRRGAAARSAPRAGRPASASPRCRSRATPSPIASSPSSPAASGPSPTTCWARCSPRLPPDVRRCSCAPASSSVSTAPWPTS